MLTLKHTITTPMKELFSWAIDAILLSVIWLTQTFDYVSLTIHQYVNGYGNEVEWGIKLVGTICVVLTAFFRLRREIKKFRKE